MKKTDFRQVWRRVAVYLQRFRVVYGLSCMIGPGQTGCYSWAALSSNDSKTRYITILNAYEIREIS